MRQIWCCHRILHYPKPYRHQTWPYYQKRLGRETLSWHVMNAACRGKAFSSWLFSYALLCLDLMSEASEEDRLQLRFLCNTLPRRPVKQLTWCLQVRGEGGGERWPAQTDEGESERQAEKSNDMLRQSWEVNGMMEYIYIAEALCPRRRVKETNGTGEKRCFLSR